MFEDLPDVITIQEAADALRINRRSVKALMDDNKIEYRKIGRIYRIRKTALLNYLGDNTEEPNQSKSA